MKATKKKILFADDDDEMRLQFCNYLKDYGYEVVEARTGRETLRLILEESQQFGLLILDVFMHEDEEAEKDSDQGFTIAGMLDDRGIKLPIKFITQHREMVSPKDFEKFSNYKDYFFKPIKPRALLKNARRWIG